MFLLVGEKRERVISKMNRDSRMKVDREFHKKLKVKASEQGLTIMELTRLLSEREDIFNVPRSKDEERKSFRFRL